MKVRTGKWWLLAAAVSVFGLTACDDGSQSDFVNAKIQTPEVVANTLAISSSRGCLLDEDCVEGAFCFHGLCSTQCSDENPCAKNLICSPSGRCTSKASLLKNGGTRHSTVVESIPGVQILSVPVSTIAVALAQATVEVELQTTEDVGDIQYIIKMGQSEEVSQLITATSRVESGTGIATYTFEIPTGKVGLGDKSKPEKCLLDTSVGEFEITLKPKRPASGMYEGQLSADRFSGVGLPVRFAVQVEPTNPSTFEEINSIALYMPVAASELFSPESVDDEGLR